MRQRHPTAGVVLSLILLTSCAQPPGKSVTPSEKESEGPAAIKNAPAVGRYQIIMTAAKTFKIDTVTGQTWIFDGDADWKILPNNSVIAASGPYDTYRVVAKKPNLSVFDLPKNQRPALVDERIRSIPDVVSVELVKPNPDADPLGIR